MQLKVFYDHGQTFKTVRFEDSITVQEAIKRFAERTPLYSNADPSLYGFYLPETSPYLSSFPPSTPSPPFQRSPSPSPAPSPPNPSPPVASAASSATQAGSNAEPGSDDMAGVGWLENDRLLASYHIKDFLLFKKKSSSYPRKIAANFTLTRIHLPTSDKTLKYDSKMTVKEAIHYLKSRNPGVDMASYGLYLLYSPNDSDGFFMDEDRTISSYDLDYQAELHFIPQNKKVCLSELTLLFPKKQVRRKTKYDTDITLQKLAETTFAHEQPLAAGEKHSFFIPPYDDSAGKTLDGSATVLHALAGLEPFAVHQPTYIKDRALDEPVVYGEIDVEVHVVAPSTGTIRQFNRKSMWASKNGITMKLKVDEETRVGELKEIVKKKLLSQKAHWASALSEWGVYIPHQTDGGAILDNETAIISTSTTPIGMQFEIKPVKRPDRFSGRLAPGLQVTVQQYNTRASNKLVLLADKGSTISDIKENIFELMGSRLTKEQARDYVLSRPSIVDDGEAFDDDMRDLHSYKLDLNVALEFKPRVQYPVPEQPMLILAVTLSPEPAGKRTSFCDSASDIFLRLPILSRSLKVCEVLAQLEEIIRKMENPKLDTMLQEFADYQLFWKEKNLWLSTTRAICSYGIPPQHTIQLQVKPIGIHIRLWNYLIPQTLGYFTFVPGTLVSDIDKKELFVLVRSEPQVSQEKFSRNRTVSIYNPIPGSPKRLPQSATDKYSVVMDVDLDVDLYGFSCVPERQVGELGEITEKPFFLDNAKTLKENSIREGSVIELKPVPQSLNVVYPDPNGGRTSKTILFDMDKPIAGFLPVPIESTDRIIWQKEPHNPSGFLLDPTQSLSAQGIRPYYGASIIINRYTLKKAKHEDNSIEGQINRDLWEELRAEEPEGLMLNSDGLVQAGTVNRLVEHLTNYKIHDLTFMKTFLLTYQAFITPRIFFTKLVSRYHVPAPPDTTDIGNFVENVQRPIQLRVCNVLKKFIDNSFKDLDQALLQDMNQFLETVLIPSGNSSLAQKIQTSILKHLQATSKPKVNITFDKSPPTSISRFISSSNSQSVMEFAALEIARQLTLLEYETYAAIEPTELLNQAWAKPTLMHRCPNIQKMINRFNGISSWVCGVLIEPEEIKQRVKVFKKIVTIGKALLELNSLNALMAVIAGWNHSGVLRLKHTIKELPKKTQEDMAYLESLMNSEGSYKKYRAYLHNANPPQIPYVGIYLSDLTFIEEGNDDTVKGLVNFEKLRLLCTVIMELQQYQQQPYNLARVPELADLLQKELVAEAAAEEGSRYQKSLLREPRGAKRDEIR